MKNILIFAFFLIAHNNYSQLNFIVEYGVQFEGEFLSESKKQNQELVKNFSGIEDFMSKHKFILKFKNGFSLYEVIPSMAVEQESISEYTAKIFIDYDNKYFGNSNDSTIIVYKELQGKKYNVQTPPLYSKWQLVNESKTINGFLCYKATSSIRNVLIEAWYCPSIPARVGPNEYKGLPGLILELSRGKLKYLATKINFNNKIFIERPQAEEISYLNFLKIFEESNTMFKKS